MPRSSSPSSAGWIRPTSSGICSGTRTTPRTGAIGPAPAGPDSVETLERLPGYRRPESDTFLQHPEWYIVYSSEEYARHLAGRRPSTFPYGVSIGQYWRTYEQATKEASAYPTNWGYQVMLWVIGISYSAELSLKALYEDTIGSIFEWTAGGQRTPEEDLAAEVAADYARFIQRPAVV